MNMQRERGPRAVGEEAHRSRCGVLAPSSPLPLVIGVSTKHHTALTVFALQKPKPWLAPTAQTLFSNPTILFTGRTITSHYFLFF